MIKNLVISGRLLKVGAVGKGGMTCYSCGGRGHVSRVCPSRFPGKGDRGEHGKAGGQVGGKGGYVTGGGKGDFEGGEE